VFIFPLQFSSETSLILRRVLENTIVSVHRYSCKVSVILLLLLLLVVVAAAVVMVSVGVLLVSSSSNSGRSISCCSSSSSSSSGSSSCMRASGSIMAMYDTQKTSVPLNVLATE
jgi:hypothetical protein